MLVSRVMKPITLRVSRATGQRWAATSALDECRTAKQLAEFDPKSYSLPLRPVTLNDTMEPYGSWKTAYAAEKKRANKTLFAGIITFAASLVILAQSGVFDAIIMPNLDNIMEETKPFEFEKEGRITF